MNSFKAPDPGASAYNNMMGSDEPIQKIPPQVKERQTAEKGERDEQLALSIMQSMVELYKGQTIDHEEFLKRCERSWLWTVTDSWPPEKNE